MRLQAVGRNQCHTAHAFPPYENIMRRRDRCRAQRGKMLSLIHIYSDRVVIENECTPIPKETISRLFEPFYRPDFARDRRDGGNGLGLYIVDTLSKAMGLSYTFGPMTCPQGMRFTLFLTK